uniref:Uncharacterized protein n=1 Tax=Kalanchoe fedtschenkoi TaxID=63787 RepID=A0A7N0TE83_KALFE
MTRLLSRCDSDCFGSGLCALCYFFAAHIFINLCLRLPEAVYCHCMTKSQNLTHNLHYKLLRMPWYDGLTRPLHQMTKWESNRIWMQQNQIRL